MKVTDIKVGETYQCKSPNSYGNGAKVIVRRVDRGMRPRIYIDLGRPRWEGDNGITSVPPSNIIAPWTEEAEAGRLAGLAAEERRLVIKRKRDAAVVMYDALLEAKAFVSDPGDLGELPRLALLQRIEKALTFADTGKEE